MKSKSLDEITDEVLKLYDKGLSVDEIADISKTETYIVESILINQRDIYFR